jgi:hypothetical protein
MSMGAQMRIMRKLVAVGVGLLVAGNVCADDVNERIAALEARLAEMEQRLEQRTAEMEQRLAQSAREEAAPFGGAGDVSNRLVVIETHLAEIEARPLKNQLDGVELGGYGELHYNALSGKGGAPGKREIDFHRFVLYIGKTFSDRLRFASELELEHVMAGAGEKGYMALEQAYLDYDLTERHTARAGLFLVPAGLINPTHEPSRFYGVERNPVERDVIPTTWFEAGAGAHGLLTENLRYEAYLHSGLKAEAGKNYSVRSGRQKVASANASAPAATLALNWSIPGLTLGGALHHQTDITQGLDPAAGRAWMAEAHADWRHGPFGLRALYAEWSLDGDGPASVGANRQYGWYVEPSYRISSQLGIFARYNAWDNQAGQRASASRKSQVDFGVNWWPHEQVVVKADYQWQDHENARNQSGINLGVGYEF